MKTKKILLGLGLALSMGVLYTGCDKSKVDELTDTDTSSAQSNSESENAVSEVFKSLNDVGDENSDLRAKCYTVQIDTTVGPTGPWSKTVTINFAGCPDKSGKLIAVFTGPWTATGTLVTLTGDALTVLGKSVVLGNATVLVKGPNSSSQPQWEIDFQNCSVAGQPFKSYRLITQSKGSTTLDHMDDEFTIEGNSSGTSSKGITYTGTITSPLVISADCKYIKSGAIELTNSTGGKRSIDFGTGACDNKATVTIAGQKFEVTM